MTDSNEQQTAQDHLVNEQPIGPPNAEPVGLWRILAAGSALAVAAMVVAAIVV